MVDGYYFDPLCLVSCCLDVFKLLQGTICVRYVQKHDRRQFDGVAGNADFVANNNVISSNVAQESGRSNLDSFLKFLLRPFGIFWCPVCLCARQIEPLSATMSRNEGLF